MTSEEIGGIGPGDWLEYIPRGSVWVLEELHKKGTLHPYWTCLEVGTAQKGTIRIEVLASHIYFRLVKTTNKRKIDGYFE